MSKFNNISKEDCRSLITELERHEAEIIARETVLDTSNKYNVLVEGLVMLDAFLDDRGVKCISSISKLQSNVDSCDKFINDKAMRLNIALDIDEVVVVNKEVIDIEREL